MSKIGTSTEDRNEPNNQRSKHSSSNGSGVTEETDQKTEWEIRGFPAFISMIFKLNIKIFEQPREPSE